MNKYIIYGLYAIIVVQPYAYAPFTSSTLPLPEINLNITKKGDVIKKIDILLDFSPGILGGIEKSIKIYQAVDLYAVIIEEKQAEQTFTINIKDPQFFSAIMQIINGIDLTSTDFHRTSEGDETSYYLLSKTLPQNSWQQALFNIVNEEVDNARKGLFPPWTASDTRKAYYGVYALQRKLTNLYNLARLKFFGY